MPHRFVSFISRSILGRLTLLIAAVLVPAAMLVGWLIVQGYRNERQTLERHLIGAARATALLVDATITQRQSLLEGLATSARLRRNELDGFREQAKSAVPSANEWIVLIDDQGQQLVNTFVDSDAPLPKIQFKPEFKEAAVRGRSYISNLTLGPASHRHIVFTAIPILRRGQLQYTLNFAMTPAVFDDALSQGGVAKEWLVAVVDRDGFIAARNRHPEQFVGVKATEPFASAIAKRSSGIIESVTLEGIKSITAFARSPKSGWTIAVAAPEADLFASAERLLLVALLVSLLLGGGTVIVALWVGRGVVAAVRTLVANTEALGRGEALGAGDTGIEETDYVFRALVNTSSRLATREGELTRLNETLLSAAKTLRERQERLDAARTAAATGTFVWHVSSGTFESDESLNALFALREGEAVRSIDEFVALIHENDRARVRAALDQCTQTATDLIVEFQVRRHDGTTRWLFTKGRMLPAAERGGAYMAAACVDVTERKQNEAEISRVRDSALAAARAKDEFLAALSHELRTPLNPVLLAASDGAVRAEYPEAAREAFAMIAKNARLEARLIDDLLDLTRIAQGKLSLDQEQVDLHAVLREAISNVQPELEEKQHQLDLRLQPEPIFVVADPIRLQQVFWNVLKNAVKFTPVCGHITIETRTAAPWIEVEIADDGIGMTPAEIARSFQPFSQGDHAAHRTAHRFGGLGLGLAISRVLLELHSGEIEARSPGRGQGSTFIIRIPMASPAVLPSTRPNQPGDSAAKTSGGGGLRILLVEDHEPTRVTLERLLKRRQYDVMAAGTAAEALYLASQQTFDLVVSDIGLPDTDGCAMMEKLKASYGLPGIALTGYGMEEDLARSQAAGFFAHLTKPVDIHKLEAVLLQFRHGTRSSSG